MIKIVGELDGSMKEYYLKNENFKNYVDKCCKSSGITAEEAFTHKVVQEVYKSLQEE